MMAKFYRKVGRNIRYYIVECSPTLFGEYLLVKKYGNIANKKPTGMKKQYFKQYDEAMEIFNKVINKKLKKGYTKYIQLL